MNWHRKMIFLHESRAVLIFQFIPELVGRSDGVEILLYNDIKLRLWMRMMQELAPRLLYREAVIGAAWGHFYSVNGRRRRRTEMADVCEWRSWTWAKNRDSVWQQSTKARCDQFGGNDDPRAENGADDNFCERFLVHLATQSANSTCYIQNTCPPKHTGKA